MYGVQIKHFNISQKFDLSSKSNLILDCDYSYNENDLNLVIRWFYKNRTEPIYQWLPEIKSRDVAEDFKSSFNMNYVTDVADPYTMFRAVNIFKPKLNMSGKYSCRISSLVNDVLREGYVYIYGKCIFVLFLGPLRLVFCIHCIS